MEDLKILIRKRRGKEQVDTSKIEQSFSQTQEEFLIFQDLDLDLKFEQSLLRYKSESDLKKVVVDQSRFHSYLLDSL